MLIIDGLTPYPAIKAGKEGACIACQHCLAVCPTGSLSIWGKEPAEATSTKEAKPARTELANLMTTRRSIRRFKKQAVEPTLLREMAEKALYAPTAHNKKSVHLTLIDSPEAMQRFRTKLYEAIAAAELPERFANFAKFQQVWQTKQVDIILRDAPQFAIFSAKSADGFPVADGTLAATYFDLLACSEGLGTLWNGMVKWVLEDIAPELKSELGIPEGYEVVITLLVGYSATKYARSVVHNTPAINVWEE